jgi:hypothetical protein
VIPFITMQLASLVVVGYFPGLVNYLPSRVALLSENAPPPRNPRLQYCVEQYLSVRIPAQEGTVRGLIAAARAADASALPAARQRDLTRALDAYDLAFERWQAFEASSRAIAEATPAYRPLHRQVGEIRREMERLGRQATTLEARLRNYRGDDPDDVATRTEIEGRIADLRARVVALEATIPERWDPEHRAFLALNQAELDARRAFRQPTEQAYVALRDIVAELAAGEAYEGLLPLVIDVAGRVGQDDPEALATEVRGIESRLGAIPGSGAVREALTDLRNALSGRRANAERAAEAAPAAVAAVEAEIAWRAAADRLESVLAPLEAETRTTLGLREQARLERSTALQVASCLSHHRDVSLNF